MCFSQCSGKILAICTPDSPTDDADKNFKLHHVTHITATQDVRHQYGFMLDAGVEAYRPTGLANSAACER
jgi:hypothetical protein